MIPHLPLAPPFGSPRLSFCQDLRHQRTRVPWLSCGVVCVILYTISRFSRTPTCDRQTHSTTAYTALAWHCAVKKQVVKEFWREAASQGYFSLGNFSVTLDCFCSRTVWTLVDSMRGSSDVIPLPLGPSKSTPQTPSRWVQPFWGLMVVTDRPTTLLRL